MEQVEAKLARAGRNCNSRTVERITGNARKVKGAVHAQVADYAFAAQLAVLRNCPVVMARLLNSGGSHLLVAKVLVLSRLLHKALSQSSSPGPTPPIVDHLRDRILSARRKLLRRIDKRLASPTCDAPALVETMCAYALATSDTPTQLLRHFHKSRLDSIVRLLDHDELARHGTAALRLCIQTCQDTQAIFPRRLAESLAKLKTQPLIRDADVRALYELNLRVHDRWFGDETRDYTPWPRHDELQRADADKILHQWSKQAVAAFLSSIRTALENEHRLQEVASLRQELVETWILSGSRMAGVKSANVLDNLRDTMNSHLESIVHSRAQNLKAVALGVSHLLASWSSTTPSPSLSLWTALSNTGHATNGAVAFKSKVLATHQGRDEAVANVVSTFDAWISSVLQVKGIVKSMKDARWDDTFADDDDDLDGDDFGESRQTLLSDDDPRLLEEVTQKALANALQNLGKSFSQIVGNLTRDEQAGDVQRICFVLRVMRDVGEKIPTLKLHDRATPPSTPFTSELLEPLHRTLARQIVQPVSKAFQKSLDKASNTTSKSHVLWEGHPVLPAQPSPSAFRYLQGLTKTMAGYGSDLWAPTCVSVLKQLACESVSAILQVNLDSILNSTHNFESTRQSEKEDAEGGNATEDGPLDPNADVQPAEEGEEKAAPSSPASVDTRSRKLKQAAFDALFIQRFVGDIGNGDPIDALFKNLKQLDDDTKAKLKKSATDYAKKTYLLFALLA